MKQIKYILFALACTLGLSSCMDGDWSNPVNEDTQNTFGNQYITETNRLTIEQLKNKYSTVINEGTYEQVSKPTQIKGIVTGNDVEGNIYNEISLQDETGAIIVCIAQGGLFGFLPIGQEILIELEGLYIGGYGKMAEIGTLYTSATGSTYVSRMSRATWNNHFRILSSDNPVTPMEVTNVGKLDFDKDAGKLITLRGVQLQDANGTAVFAPNDGSVKLTANCANRAFVGISSNKLVLRTSTYSDFANAVMPTGTIDVTGIFTRYNNTWQILLRKASDIQPSSYVPEPPVEPKGDGTKANPYNVAGVLAYIETLGADVKSSKDVYVEGIITGVTEKFNTDFGNATFTMSDSEDGTSEFTFYRGMYFNNKKYSDESATNVKKGDKVVICGKVINFRGTTPETQQNEAYVVSINDEGGDDTPDIPDTPGGDGSVTVNVDGTVLTLTNGNVTASSSVISVDLSAQGWANAEEVTTVTLTDGTTITFSKGEGGTTPKFYTATNGVRLYAKNTITVTGASKAIAKVILNCDSYSGTDYVGNPTLYGTASGKTLTIVNEHDSTSGGVQLRVKTIDITYAE